MSLCKVSLRCVRTSLFTKVTSYVFHFDVVMLPIKCTFCMIFISSDTMRNKGAFITLVAPDLKPKFTSYEAVVGGSTVTQVFHTADFIYLTTLTTVEIKVSTFEFCPSSRLSHLYKHIITAILTLIIWHYTTCVSHVDIT